MSGERPVPVGTFNESCASERNQYLETGELNQRGIGGNGRTASSVPKTSRGDRDTRLSTSAISNVGGYGSNSYMESGPPDFDESRSFSRNGYYERDPPPVDYLYGERERDPYYGQPSDYGPPRRSGRPPVDPYYRGGERERSYGAPSYRPHNPPDYYPQEPFYGMYNTTPRRGFQSPRQSTSAEQQQHQQLTAYLEEFRVRDPVRYREWYEKYKEHKKNPKRIPQPKVPGFTPHASQQPHYPIPRHPQQNGDGTRTPIHYRHPSQPSRYEVDSRSEKAVPPSGRSSRNERSYYQSDFDEKDQFRSDESEFEQGFAPIDQFSKTETHPDRLTPQKFTIGHSIGLITPFGHVLRVASGSRTVEVVHIKSLMKDLPEYQELEAFPGPLKRKDTPKSTVLKFCQKKIKHIQNQEFQADKDNLILLWELLILLIKQNGSVVGSDIAEILLKKKARLDVGGGAESESNNSEIEDEGDDADRDSGVSTVIIPQSPNDPKITQRFCDRLLFGHRTDALDFAMQKGLWGHALFLASKLGEREYGHVMAKFANGVAYNHPLQTLYQLLSGRVPSAMTGCLDDAFGDWKPHLAMIISNAGIRPDVEQKAFITLGDTLRNKNLIYGSQFCHLMAQCTFSEDSKLGPLLGLSADRTNVFEATQMTEIYEYAVSLSDAHFNLGSGFQRSKFDYVKSLIDYGFTRQAFSYCEEISKQIGTLGNKNDPLQNLRWDLIQVGERLRYADPSNNSDWVQELRTALLDTQMTDNSETSSRRGSYPPSVEVSSIDQGSPAIDSGSVPVPPPETVVPENGYPQFIPTPNYQSDGFVNNSYQTESNTNSNLGAAYESNPTLYEVNPVPMLPTTDFNSFNQPLQSQFQPQPNTQLDQSQEPWSMQPSQPQPPTLPQTSDVRSWESNSLYYTSHQDGGQDVAYKQPDRKPSMYNMPAAVAAGPNNNMYPPGTFIPPSTGMENGYQGTGFQSQPSMQHGATANIPKTQPSLENSKRKTVRFEDDDDGKSIRMSRIQALNILQRVESDEVTESDDEEIPKLPVQFKSTFPIDTPLGYRIVPSVPNPTPLRTSKLNSVRTYPVDRKCCEASQPCADHIIPPPPTSPVEISKRSAGPNLDSSKTYPLLECQQKVAGQPKDGKSEGKKVKPNTSNTNKGGLLGWLGLRGKNQMILPDDKEPAIVWDDKKKQWVNTKDDEDDTTGPRGPPPKDTELMSRTNPLPPSSQQPMTYGNMPQENPPQMSYGQPLSATVPDGPSLTFNPKLNQPVSGGGGPQSGNWNQAQVGPGSLVHNQNQPPHQVQPVAGPQSLNLPQSHMQTLASQPPPAPNATMNKYKLPKSGRGSMRGNYVDVFGGNTAAPPQKLGMAPMMPIPGNNPTPIFVPSPAVDTEQFQEHRHQ